MGFLNGLSSDLFPQELMTQNELKNAWWEFKSFWFEGTGFGAFYTKVILKMSKSANEVNMEYACVSQGNCVSFFSTSVHIWSLELLRQVSTASLLPVVFLFLKVIELICKLHRLQSRNGNISTSVTWRQHFRCFQNLKNGFCFRGNAGFLIILPLLCWLTYFDQLQDWLPGNPKQ